MRKLYPCLRSLFFFFLLFTSVRSHASHILGADLYYTWVSGNTYTITLVLYGDCDPSSSTAFNLLSTTQPEICIKRGTTNITTIALRIQAPSSGVDITPVCPGQTTSCQSSSSPVHGIKKFVYSANYTLPAPTTSNCWQFCYLGNYAAGGATTSGRSASITNITNAGNTTIQLVDTLDNTVHPNNSSTQFTVVPTPFYCNNTPSSYNPGCVDPDGDVIDVALVNAKNGPATGCNLGGNVTYTGNAWPGQPITGATPLRVATGSFNFNNATGQLTFTPNALQRSTVVFNVREFRAGAFVGSCQREMNFLVQTCTNTPPIGGIDSASGGGTVSGDVYTMCTNAGPFNIFLNPRPSNPSNTLTVTSSGVPAGASLVVTGNGTNAPSVTFSWTSAVTPGTYVFYLTYTDNACPLAGTTTKAITVDITPTPTVGYTIVAPAVCLGKAAVNIIPSGTGAPWNLQFTGPTPHTVTGATGPFIDSLAPGTHTVLITSSVASACSGTATITIVPTSPTSALSSNSPICADSVLMLFAADTGSGVYYSWHGPNGFTSTLQNPTIPNAQVNASGTYSLTVTNTNNGCVITNTLSVTVKPTPAMPVVTGNAPCEGRDALSMSASSDAGSTYSWSGPAGFSYAGAATSISPATAANAGTYSVVATLNGCPSLTGTGTFTVNPIPPAPVGADTSYCQKEAGAVQLTATGANVLWYDNATGGTGSPTAPVPFTDTLAGTYTWYISQTINTCESPRSPVNVNILYVPVFSIEGKTPICLHDSIILSYNGPVLNTPAYSWSVPPGAAFVDGNSGGASAWVHFDIARTFNVFLSVGNYDGRCTATYSKAIEVVEPPLSHFDIKSDFCIGDTVVVALTDRSPSATKFTWDFDNATIVTQNSNSGGPYSLFWNDPGVHIITMQSVSEIGCLTPPVFDTFEVHGLPDARIKTPDNAVCLEDTVMLSAMTADVRNSYNWQPEHFFSHANALAGNNKSVVQGRIEVSGYVTLTVTDPYGCRASDQLYLNPSACCNVVFPNAFTPNGDHVNDVFRPILNGYHRFHMFRIVNRWGQVVFTSTDSYSSWDGSMNGVPQDVGVYYYYLKYDCGSETREAEGDVTLIR